MLGYCTWSCSSIVLLHVNIHTWTHIYIYIYIFTYIHTYLHMLLKEILYRLLTIFLKKWYRLKSAACYLTGLQTRNLRKIYYWSKWKRRNYSKYNRYQKCCYESKATTIHACSTCNSAAKDSIRNTCTYLCYIHAALSPVTKPALAWR